MNINSVVGRSLIALVGFCLLQLPGDPLVARTKTKHVMNGKSHWMQKKGQGALVVGAASGPNDSTENTYLVAYNLNQASSKKITYLAPLWHGTPKEGDASFIFHRYEPAKKDREAKGAYFEIMKNGNYLLQYGLTGVPNDPLLQELWTPLVPLATAWMAIEINRDTEIRRVGAVPLTFAKVQSYDPDISPPGSILTGFGQILTKLKVGDKVSLRIFLGSNYDSQYGTDDRLLFIHNDSINFPYKGAKKKAIASGPTLSIKRFFH